MMQRLARFSLAGAAGFVVDVAVLYALMRFAGFDPYVARAISFFAAATFTWWCNRHFTFNAAAAPALAQWARFLAANGVGGAVNYGAYAALIATLPLMHAYPAIAAGAGAVAGLVVNFTLSQRLVFASAPAARIPR
jgi:putative flippase GtrA